MTEIVFIVEPAPEGGWTARALGESIFAEADTEAELRVAVQDAMYCHFDKGQSPEVIRLQFVGEQPGCSGMSASARPGQSACTAAENDPLTLSQEAFEAFVSTCENPPNPTDARIARLGSLERS